VSSLLGISKHAPFIGVACCLTKPGLALIQCRQEDFATFVCFGSHVNAADTLMLILKASATVTVYRGHLP